MKIFRKLPRQGISSRNGNEKMERWHANKNATRGCMPVIFSIDFAIAKLIMYIV